MADYTEIISSVARRESVSHGASFSGAGALGLSLEWKHAAEAFIHMFGKCHGVVDVLRCLIDMDSTTYLGLI